MPPTVFRYVRSEGRVRTLLGHIALLVGPAVIALLMLAAKWQGLQTPRAIDQAQLARHLAEGDGFTTSAILPASLAFHANPTNHPDLYNAPVSPVVLSVFFRIIHPSDRVVAAAGAALWMASIWLTYLVARAWCRPAAAGVAALLYGVSVSALNAALQGQPYVVASAFTLLAAWLALGHLPGHDAEPGPAELPVRRAARCGVASALAFLSHYQLVVVPVVLGAFIALTQRQSRRNILAFAAGFVALVGPWFVRNLVAGGPVFGLYWYETLAGTGDYAGDSVWRSLARPPNPVVFAVTNPLQMLRKIVVGFSQYRGAALDIVDPIVAFLVLAALFGAMLSRRWRWLAGLVAVGVAFTVLAGCVLRPEPLLLIAWVPVLAVVAGVQLTTWVDDHVRRFSFGELFEALPGAKPPSPAGPAGHAKSPPAPRYVPTRVMRLLVYAGLVALLAYPLAYYLTRTTPATASRLRASFRPLEAWLPENALVMSDQPALVAWYAERNAIALLQREDDLAKLERAGAGIEAVLVTAGIQQTPPAERGDWWSWVAAARGVFRGLAVAPRSPPGTVLRMRGAGKQPAEIGDRREEVARNPDSAEARVALASACLANDYLRDAAENFRRAIQLDPQSAESVMGLWQVAARLNDVADAIPLALRANQLSLADPNAPALLGEAARAFEQGLAARPNDPWLLLNAALCQAKLKRWDRAESYSRRAAEVVPHAITPRLMLASLYLDQGLIDRAAVAFEKLAEEQPGNALVHEALGRTRRAQGRLPEALDELAAAQRLRPDWLPPWLNAGDVQLRLQQYDEAGRAFAKALQIAPRSLPAALGLMQSHAARGDFDRAIEQCEQSLQVFPDNPLLLNNLAFYLTQKGRSLDRAIEIAQRLVAGYPNNAVMRDTLGAALLTAGRAQDAISQLKQAVALAPNAAGTRLHLAQALAAGGQRVEAGEAARAALLLGLPAAEKAEAQKLATP